MFASGGRAHDWTELECVLAIWAYHRIDRDRTANKAELYRTVASLIPRSVGAVEYKVQNVSACDPRPPSEKPIAEKEHRQALLQQLFDEYWPKRAELDAIYDQCINLGFQGFLDGHHVPAIITRVRRYLIEEGAIIPATGTARLRSQALAAHARAHYRGQASDGKLRCLVCSMSFDEAVPNTEIIHIHHLDPIQDVDDAGRTLTLDEAVERVRPVCPTCHSLIHSRRPPLSIAEATALRTRVEVTNRGAPLPLR